MRWRMSAFGGKADISDRAVPTSAYDPKRTLPIERHAHQRPMLHDVQGVLAEPTILTEIDGKRAVADNQCAAVNRSN